MTHAGRRAGPEKKYLKALTDFVRGYIYQMDELMKQPSTVERGRQVAKLSNALELANDQARYHGLGVDYRKDKPYAP